MNSDNKQKLKTLIEDAEKLGCEVSINEPLKNHTTFKVGGCCQAMISLNSTEAASKLFAESYMLEIPVFVMGKGSNLLCDDEGFCGVIFILGKSFQDITLLDEVTIEAEAGCSLSKLCSFACDNGLSGLEFAYGIPGTVGGAVYMNAGAYGGEIKDVIISAEQVDICGNINVLKKEDMEMSYRHSIFEVQNSVITKAVFRLRKGEPAEIMDEMLHFMNCRREKQPLEYPNAGSTFKRPEGQFAGKLIQDCGLKGLSVGGAQVSEKHSGFVINKGNATSNDIKELIEQVQNTVLEKTGYYLACEVKILPYSGDLNR